MLKGNMLIAHGGGPTPVMNCSLLGAIKEARKSSEIERIFGARFGADGILKNDLIDLSSISDNKLSLLINTPSSALGSCRTKLTEKDCDSLLNCFQDNNIRYFFYNGGNDSMDTCYKIELFAQERNYDIRVIGIPKTIDNDLVGTDHCPGFGSAAKYYALSILELSFDASALPIHVLVIEIMGRNAGWLAASTSLYKDKMPSELLVYLPELPFSKEQFLKDVDAYYSKGKGLIVAVSEGIRYIDGSPVADTGFVDGFGHNILGGTAQTLADMIISNLNLKARGEKPGLLGRTSMGYISTVDQQEAVQVGEFAVKCALKGISGIMVGFKRLSLNDYHVDLAMFPLNEIANAEKPFPNEWINESKNGILPEFTSYCYPLIGETNIEYCYLR